MEDRTYEFMQLASSLPASAPPPPPPRPEQQQQKYASLREFHTTAANISHDIASTSALLTELTNLVRHQSLMDDHATQVNDLVVRIKHSIENLNSRLDQASMSIAQHKRLSQQAGQEASNLVEGLKTEFAQAATGFKKVLQQRTDHMKETDLMQKQVYGQDAQDDDPMPNMSTLAPPPVFGEGNNMMFPALDLTSGLIQEAGQDTSSLPRPQGVTHSGGGGSSLRHRHNQNPTPTYSGAYASFEDEHQPLTPLELQRLDEESGTQMQLIPDQDYLQQRADAMSTVESQIVELGSIFSKLAGLVSEHRDLVQRVEDNVDDAATNIDLSLASLADTLTSLRTNRALALKVFSIIVLFIMFFIIFVA